MLKKRIIPVQLLLNKRLVKTKKFDSFIDVGNPVRSSKIYNDSDADELIILNIDRKDRSIKALIDVLEDVSKVCFMPLSLGGGIKSLKDIELLFRNGADKIILNSSVYNNYELLNKASIEFGRQSIVVSMDAMYNNTEHQYNLFSDCGKKREPTSLPDHLKKCEEYGAGEFFINSIDNDGIMNGYDENLISLVTNISDLPVIVCGGVGNYGHMKDAFKKFDVSAVACGSLFNFGDNNPIRAKSFLKNYDINFKIIK